MGCFDGRCAVTGLPIRYGQEVFAIVYNKKSSVRDTYDLGQHLLGMSYRGPMIQELIENAEEVLETTRKMSKELGLSESDAIDNAERKLEYLLTRVNKDSFTHWAGLATYNDYGWAQDADGNDLGDVPEDHSGHNAAITYRQENYGIIMVHSWALRSILEWKNPDTDLEGDCDYLDVVKTLADYCFMARIELFTDSILGIQHWDSDEMDHHEHLAKMILYGAQQARLESYSNR